MLAYASKHWSSGPDKGTSESETLEFCWLSGETKIISPRVSTLKLPPTLLLWLVLWREGEIVFFELYDLKGHGQKIPSSFTVFS